MLDLPYLVAVVDDEPDIVEIISESIKFRFSDKVVIHPFIDPKEAFAFIQENEISIVISDLKMPGLHGLDFTRELMKLERGIQCVVISGDTTFSSIFECFMNGVRAFISKPATIDQVSEAMNKCFDHLQYWKKLIEGAPDL